MAEQATTTARRRRPPQPDPAELEARLRTLTEDVGKLAVLIARTPPAANKAAVGGLAGRLTSRKFLLAVLAGATVGGADALGWQLEKETVLGLLGVLFTYVFGESYVDGQAARGRNKQ